MVLGAGGAKRFGRNKLAAEIPSPAVTMPQHLLASLRPFLFHHFCPPFLLVTNTVPSQPCAFSRDWQIVPNPSWQEGLSRSLRYALQAIPPHLSDGCIVFLADMPLVHLSTVHTLLDHATRFPGHFIRPYSHGIPGFPVFLPSWSFAPLLQLSGDKGALSLIKKHPNKSIAIRGTFHCAWDVDRPEDMLRLEQHLKGIRAHKKKQ
ncbi:MAG TPA: nucleotidyltransferase family protein [Thermotogota bacterium]|nr:nucleotidyltransferase family protein [Thermotogota bacterium]